MGIDQWGLFWFTLVKELFYGWYDPGPTIYDVELSYIKGSNPLTALLAYKLYNGWIGISGFNPGTYYGPGVILYFFYCGGN